MTYYIIENQIRADGIVNNTVTSRSSFATGLSYFYERAGKMAATTLYPKVAIMLLDEDLNVMGRVVLNPPYEEPEETTDGSN